MFDNKNIDIFSSRDKIRLQLLEYMKEYLELENLDVPKTSYLAYIINVLSGLTSNLIFYTSSVYREFFLTKAIQKESVINHAAILGYSPPLASPSTCSLLIEIPLTFSGNAVAIMKGINQVKDDFVNGLSGNSSELYNYSSSSTSFKFYSGNISFAPLNTITITIKRNIDSLGSVTYEPIVTEKVPDGIKTINCIVSDGSLKFLIDVVQVSETTNEFTIPTLKPYEFLVQRINFSGSISDIGFSTSVLTSQNKSLIQVWETRQSLFLIPSGVKGFVYKPIENGIKLFFGNGIIGTQPTPGDIGRVFICTTLGSGGNVISGTIRNFDRLYVKVTNGTTEKISLLNMNCVNTEPSSGGVDFPSIDEIRNNAIAQVSANDRLVSYYDFQNINSIIPTLPIKNLIPILKRSDIKRNEITLYGDLFYEDSIVPTKNETIIIDNISHPGLVINNSRYLSSGDFLIDDVYYKSMFSIEVNADEKYSTYKYIMDQISSPLTIEISWNDTELYPTGVDFYVDQEVEDPVLIVTFNYMKIVRVVKENYSDARLTITTNNQTDTYDPALYSADPSLELDDFKHYYNDPDFPGSKRNSTGTTPEFKFVKKYLLSTIPDGEIKFSFLLEKNIGENGAYSWESLNKSFVITIIKRTLDDYMYSQVQTQYVDSNGDILEGGDTTAEDSTQQYILYDVPVIRKGYLDSMSDTQRNSFESSVYHKIIDLNLEQYRMLTDFVNLKFSNSTGYSRNMLYNKETLDPVHSVDPSSIPNLNDSDFTGEDPQPMRFLVTKDKNPWSLSYGRIKGGFIAEYVEGRGWFFESISVNDIFSVTSEDKKYIYNGEDVIEPVMEIPIKIKVAVWIDSSSAAQQTVVDNIKNSLVDQLYESFGHDASIYRSKILNIVQSVKGVSHCTILLPEHDIFFNYDLDNDFTQEELLRYSPDLIFFDTRQIEIMIMENQSNRYR